MPLPNLNPKAAYLVINNAAKRNALSLAVLRDLKNQLLQYNTSPVDSKSRFLPPFKPKILKDFEKQQQQQQQQRYDSYSSTHQNTIKSSPLSYTSGSTDLSWLLSSESWHQHRAHLPRVLILRTEGKVFSSGHDLVELSRQSPSEVRETFNLCAQVMRLIRRCPIPVISVLGPNQLATAAGAQLALSADMCVSSANASFQLPGQRIGLPCSSPGSAVSRVVGIPGAMRMLLLADPVRADELGSGHVDVVKDDDNNDDGEKLDQRVNYVVDKIVHNSAGQPQALGKWAFWTQVGLNGAVAGLGNDEKIGGGSDDSKAASPSLSPSGGDGYEDAVEWTGRMMAVHARADDAREGITSFFQKRIPHWKTG